ncbi:putative P-loop containing nucleoside triphosphate hydrolase [Rosa chinensis]|uniref:Putative P-loop containing nucleoside triphosphate hydrolase n=1 Tax=Rosa chinensis TaxID=74649 RepID=A0A2P6RUZ3_ROSCH|nr:putative P-loop containing nucleoside triphosphate hydrolase [Rosa chinensis]
MAVVEIFLASFLKVLLNRLTDDFLNFARQGGIDKKLKKWKDMLAAIGAVLHDAEEKQLTSEAVKLWLDDLKDLAYDVEDVLDEFSTEMIHRKVKEQQYGATMSKVRGFIPKIRFSFNFNSKIKLITDQLQDISERKDKLGLTYIGTISTSKEWLRPPSSCVLGGTPVVGRDVDKAKIVEFLSRDEPSTINFHVVAIVGMPGLGKTTLAQYIFNDSDDDVLKQFNLKVWVSVSDNFNIVRVTKQFLNQSRPNTVNGRNSVKFKMA